MKIIHVYTSELKKLPKDKFKEEGIEQTLIEKAPYYGKIIAQNHNGSKVILKLVKEIKDLYSEPTAEDLAHFKNLGIQYEEIKEIPVGYFQTVLARKYGAYLSLKNILKNYLREKIEQKIGDTQDLLADFKNSQFFFQSLSARCWQVQLMITQAQIEGVEIPKETVELFRKTYQDYMPLLTTYVEVVENKNLVRTSDLKLKMNPNLMLTLIMKESEIGKLVDQYLEKKSEMGG